MHTKQRLCQCGSPCACQSSDPQDLPCAQRDVNTPQLAPVLESPGFQYDGPLFKIIFRVQRSQLPADHHAHHLVFIQRLGCLSADRLPVAQDRHKVGNFEDFLQAVGDEDD